MRDEPTGLLGTAASFHVHIGLETRFVTESLISALSGWQSASYDSFFRLADESFRHSHGTGTAPETIFTRRCSTPEALLETFRYARYVGRNFTGRLEAEAVIFRTKYVDYRGENFTIFESQQGLQPSYESHVTLTGGMMELVSVGHLACTLREIGSSFVEIGSADRGLRKVVTFYSENWSCIRENTFACARHLADAYGGAVNCTVEIEQILEVCLTDKSKMADMRDASRIALAESI